MLPGTIVIGAAKAATTSLCELMAQHPDVLLSQPKEPAYFSAWYERGPAWYESHFAHHTAEPVVVDGSTSYTIAGRCEQAPERIAADLPDARFIYMVRDPVKRAVSHWIQLWENRSGELPPFAEAVTTIHEIVDTSLYTKQLDAYRALFEDDRFLVLFFEDFVRDPGEVLVRALEFVGVDPNVQIGDLGRPRNAWSSKRKDGRLLEALRKLPLAAEIRGLVPAGARARARELLKQPLDARPTWTREDLVPVLDRVKPDAVAFLERWGKAPDFWPLQVDAYLDEGR